MQPCGPADSDPISFQSFCGPDQTPESDDCIPLSRAVQIPKYNSKGEIVDRTCYDALQLAQWFARARQSLVHAFGDIDVRAVYTDPQTRVELSRAVLASLLRVPDVRESAQALELSADLQTWNRFEFDRNLQAFDEKQQMNADARRLAVLVGAPVWSLFLAMIQHDEGTVYTFQERLGMAILYVALFWAMLIALPYGVQKLDDIVANAQAAQQRRQRLLGGAQVLSFAAAIKADVAHVPSQLRGGAQNIDAIVLNPHFDVLVDRMLHQLR